MQTGSSGNNRPLIEYTSDIIDNYSLTVPQLLSKKYTVKNGVSVTNVGNLVILLKVALDSRYFTSLGVSVSVNRT